MTRDIITTYFDPYAKDERNFFKGELVEIGNSRARAFILRHGAFYTKDFEMRLDSDETVLVNGEHYQFLHYDAALGAITGRDVSCGVILLGGPNAIFENVVCDYRAVGGKEGNSSYLLEKLRDAIDKVGDGVIDWYDIPNLPDQFPPIPHLHDATTDLTNLGPWIRVFEAMNRHLADRHTLMNSHLYIKNRVNRLEYYSAEFMRRLNNLGTVVGHTSIGDIESWRIMSEQAWHGRNNLQYRDTVKNMRFDIPAYYGSPSKPVYGNFTHDINENDHSAIMHKIWHKDTILPSFPDSWTLVGTIPYVADALNVIHAEFIRVGEFKRVEYWVAQEFVDSEVDGPSIAPYIIGMQVDISGYVVIDGIAPSGSVVELRDSEQLLLGSSPIVNGTFKLWVDTNLVEPNIEYNIFARDLDGNTTELVPVFIPTFMSAEIEDLVIDTVVFEDAYRLVITGSISEGDMVELRDTQGILMGITSIVNGDFELTIDPLDYEFYTNYYLTALDTVNETRSNTVLINVVDPEALPDIDVPVRLCIDIPELTEIGTDEYRLDFSLLGGGEQELEFHTTPFDLSGKTGYWGLPVRLLSSDGAGRYGFSKLGFMVDGILDEDSALSYKVTEEGLVHAITDFGGTDPGKWVFSNDPNNPNPSFDQFGSDPNGSDSHAPWVLGENPVVWITFNVTLKRVYLYFKTKTNESYTLFAYRTWDKEALPTQVGLRAFIDNDSGSVMTFGVEDFTRPPNVNHVFDLEEPLTNWLNCIPNPHATYFVNNSEQFYIEGHAGYGETIEVRTNSGTLLYSSTVASDGSWNTIDNIKSIHADDIEEYTLTGVTIVAIGVMGEKSFGPLLLDLG